MTEGEVQRKGMSKGCLISLIVAGSILVLIIIAMIVAYMNCGKIITSSSTYMINQTKTMIAEVPPAGVDTTEYNAIADQVVERLRTENIDIKVDTALAATISGMVNEIQYITNDSKIDSAEVSKLYEWYFRMYPDLQPVAPEELLDEVDTLDLQ